MTGEWPRTDVHNAREAAWARSRPVSEVLSRLDSAHERAMRVARTLTSAELADAKYLRKIQDGSGEHYAIHLDELTS